jgi:hypothetical protein
MNTKLLVTFRHRPVRIYTRRFESGTRSKGATVKLDELRELREKATPGPWDYIPEVSSQSVVFGPHASTLAQAGWMSQNPEVDARLIALAPDLARLVERLVDVLQVMDDEGAFSVLANGALYRQMFTNALASLAELGEEGG